MAEQFLRFEPDGSRGQRHAQDGRQSEPDGIDPLKLLPPELLPKLSGGKNPPEKKEAPRTAPATLPPGIGDAPWLPQLGPPARDGAQQPEGHPRRGFFGGGSRRVFVPDTAPRPEARIAVPPAAAPQKEVGPVVIPTLHMGKPADKNDRTEHERGSLAAKIFIEHKDSIVQIFGKGEMVEKNGKKAPFGDAGTGFFVTDDGRIVTAYHVVRDTNSLTVKTAQGKEYKAEIVKVDPDADLALIKLSDRQPDERFKAMSIGKTAPNAGDEVFTIGHPQGWSENFLSAGKYLYAASSYKIELNKLSFTKNVVESSKIHVEPGNSGGPLINKDGEAIGVISRLAYRGATKLESTGVADMQRFLGKAETASSSADVAFPSTLHLLNHNLNLYYRGRALVSERPGGVGSAFSIGLGVWDLATEDVTNFKNSVSNGSTRDIIGSSLHLGADALLIGGGIAGLTSRYRMAGTIAAAAGSAFKVGSDIVQGARATHKAFSG